MTSLARTERVALCDTALRVGASAPTLCGDWTVKDLTVHLLVRERSPAALGIALKPIAPLTDLEYRRVGRSSFPVLVDRLRSGPPRLSPYALPRVDALLNSLEFFVHHEDIRRAQPDWSPRALGGDDERTLWSMLAPAGRRLTRSVPVGLTIQDTVTGASAVLRSGSPSVTVSGAPGDLVLYVFGRSAQARVELSGEPDAVARLRGTTLRV